MFIGDAALFSIANASRTNVMWLESPSLKLKYEFLNWIAISLMDHGGNYNHHPSSFQVLYPTNTHTVAKFLKKIIIIIVITPLIH